MNLPLGELPTLFESSGHYGRELAASEVPLLQELFEANPEYFILVNGRRPNADEAQVEFDELPPAHLTYNKRWFLGLFDRARDLAGVAVVVSDFCATGVWHIALLLLATRLHGRGAAGSIYDALEVWMRRQGAKWLRLGVVEGNARAERFWAKCGFCEVRTRLGVDTGGRVNNVRVLVKSLDTAAISGYLNRVPRDQPDSRLP
jgi:GNAT superfamily N-acetyltransferase